MYLPAVQASHAVRAVEAAALDNALPFSTRDLVDADVPIADLHERTPEDPLTVIESVTRSVNEADVNEDIAAPAVRPRGGPVGGNHNSCVVM